MIEGHRLFFAEDSNWQRREISLKIPVSHRSLSTLVVQCGLQRSRLYGLSSVFEGLNGGDVLVFRFSVAVRRIRAMWISTFEVG